MKVPPVKQPKISKSTMVTVVIKINNNNLISSRRAPAAVRVMILTLIWEAPYIVPKALITSSKEAA